MSNMHPKQNTSIYMDTTASARSRATLHGLL